MTSGESDMSLSQSSVQAGAALKGKSRRGRRSTFWRIREEIPWQLEACLGVASVVTPLLIWSLLYLLHVVSPIFLPSPVEAAQAGYRLATDGLLLDDTIASTRRVGIGFSISLLIAVPVGLGMGTFRSVRSFFEPFIGLVRYAPATAFMPLLLIWLGIGEDPKIALVVIGTVFFNTLMIANVVWQVPSELIKVSQTLGAGSLTVFRKVIFPHAIPGMIDTARVNLAAAWNLIIVAELLAANEGLGVRITRAGRGLNIDQIFAVIVVIGVIGVTSDIGLRLLRNRLSPWSQE